MSQNYENAVFGKRRLSLANETSATLQQDNRLASELERIEKAKEKAKRRNSDLGFVVPKTTSPKRKASLSETRMQRTLSKYDMQNPLELTTHRRSSTVVPADPAESSPARRRSLPYAELVDKDRFDKFCNATRRLSVEVREVKEYLKIGQEDETGFMGDMNEYFRKSYRCERLSESKGGVRVRKHSNAAPHTIAGGKISECSVESDPDQETETTE